MDGGRLERERSRSPPRGREAEREEGEASPASEAGGGLADLFGLNRERSEEEALIEARRKRRAAILERHRQQQQAIGATPRSAPPSAALSSRPDETKPTAATTTKTTTTAATTRPPSTTDDPPARVPDLPSPSTDATSSKAGAPSTSRGGGGGGDMFASDDDDDMFASDKEEDGAAANGASAKSGPGAGKGEGDPARLAGPANAEPEAIRGKGLADDWDDAEGYYNFRVGEVLCGKYEVYSNCGQGVFSTVLRARDVGWNEKKEAEAAQGAGSSAGNVGGNVKEYAVKVVRANEVMRKAAEQEVNILKKLAGADPGGKKHCIHLIDTFEYRNHVCMVFEALSMNLREVVKKFGRGVGINLDAVQTYSHQLLTALKLLRTCGILHADIKPDNILVNASHSQVKLCDLGSAMYAGDNELTPYVSCNLCS